MLYLLGTGAFCFVGGIEGRQRKVELVCEGCSRGVEVLWCGGIGGRQRKVASVRAGTPSGDTTRAP